MAYTLGYDYGRQILVDRRTTKSCCFLNRLILADIKNYCALHGEYSCIHLRMQDYSKGKGDESIYVNFHIDPADIKNLKNIVDLRYQSYKRTIYKPSPDGNNFSQLDIIRNPNNNNPWLLQVTNGLCNSNKEPVKVFGKINIGFTEDGFWNTVTTVYDFLMNWERFHQTLLLKQGEPLTQKALAEARARGKHPQDLNYLDEDSLP